MQKYFSCAPVVRYALFSVDVYVTFVVFKNFAMAKERRCCNPCNRVGKNHRRGKLRQYFDKWICISCLRYKARRTTTGSVRPNGEREGASPQPADMQNDYAQYPTTPKRTLFLQNDPSTPNVTVNSDDEDSEMKDSDDEWVPLSDECDRDTLDTINRNLIKFGQSPFQRKRCKSGKYSAQKMMKISECVKKAVIPPKYVDKCELLESITDSRIIDALVIKFRVTAKKSEQLQILTVAAAAGFSIENIVSRFGTTPSMAKKARSLYQTKGILSTPNPRVGNRLIADRVISLVDKFYNLDDVASRILPGTNDVFRIKNNGVTTIVRKRLLLHTLPSLYKMFKEIHASDPEVKIGKTKFNQLRPKHCVFPGTPGTQIVCVCCIHENAKLLIDSINLKELTKGEINPLSNYKDCMESMVCDIKSPACCLGECPQCPGFDPLGARLLRLFDDNMMDEIEYHQWTTTDRCDLQTLTASTQEFVEICENKFEKLLPHSFISKSQSSFLQDLKNNLQEGEVLVVGDFSENYSMTVQSAPQGHHWTNVQATLHTYVVYFKVNGELHHFSHACISDCLKHDTTAVHFFQSKLMTHIAQRVPFPIKKIKYFSDGCAAQYKNRKSFLNLTYHEEDFGYPAEHHFFATSHGKYACDAVAGSIKNKATRASLVRQGSHVINSPLQFYNYVRDNMPTIAFDFVKSSEIESHAATLEARFSRSRTIPGTQKLHCFIPVSVGVIIAKEYSASATSKSFNVM